MAYLNIQGLTDGKVYTTTYINGTGEEVALYVYIDHNGDVRVTRDKTLNGGGKNLKSSVLLLNTWKEYVPETKVYLTDQGLKLMELSNVAFRINNRDDYELLMKAIENSTDITWNHGDSPTQWGGYNDYIVISPASDGRGQAIYWGIYHKNEAHPTIHVENSKGWLFKHE